MRTAWGLLSLVGLGLASCPHMDNSHEIKRQVDTPEGPLEPRGVQNDGDFLGQFEVKDSDAFITSDAGGPIEDGHSLKRGNRGPTLLKDFIFR